MKLNILIALGFAGAASAAGLPQFLDGPVWGHLVSTEPHVEHYTSHPTRQIYGSISEGTLSFQSYVVSQFEVRESEDPREHVIKTEKLDVKIITLGHVEYRARSDAFDVRLSFMKPFRGIYTITVRTPEGGYERYNIKMKNKK